MAANQEPTDSGPTTTSTTTSNTNVPNKFDVSPSSLAALKTLSSISGRDVEQLTNCDKLTASLEQIRASKNMKLFEKLEQIRQDFSGLNSKLAQMEDSILDLKEVTNDFVKSLPPDRVIDEDQAKY